MATLIYSYRSDSEDAYRTPGNKEFTFHKKTANPDPGLIASASVGVLGGGNVLNCLAGDTFQGLEFPGQLIPLLSNGFAIMLRIDPLAAAAAAGNRAIFYSRSAINSSRFEINVRNGGNIKVLIQGDQALDVVNAISAAAHAFAVGTIADVGIKWSGGAGDDLELWVNGALFDSLTPDMAAPAHLIYSSIVLGFGGDASRGYAHLNELLVWEGDDVDFTEFTGPARAAFYETTAYVPAESNPTAAQVKTGVSFGDGIVGTLENIFLSTLSLQVADSEYASEGKVYITLGENPIVPVYLKSGNFNLLDGSQPLDLSDAVFTTYLLKNDNTEYEVPVGNHTVADGRLNIDFNGYHAALKIKTNHDILVKAIKNGRTYMFWADDAMEVRSVSLIDN